MTRCCVLYCQAEGGRPAALSSTGTGATGALMLLLLLLLLPQTLPLLQSLGMSNSQMAHLLLSDYTFCQPSALEKLSEQCGGEGCYM